MTLLSASNLTFWLLICSILLTGISMVLAYTPGRYTVILSFIALILGKYSGAADLDTSSLVFWGVASAIVLGINFLLPQQVSGSRVGLPYFATGALVGAILGLLTNTTAGVICASAACTAMAAIAFGRQPKGAVLEFPSSKFFNYLCAKGLPLVVVFSMLGILCLHFVNLGAKI